MRHLKLTIIGLFVALLVGCTLSYDQQLQNGYDLNVAARDLATQSLNAGRLTSEQGENVLEITDNARKLLDTAAQGDELGLDLAREVLQAIKRETP